MASEAEASSVAGHLTELKAEHPKLWMMVTNSHGGLAPKALLKVCAKHSVQAEGEADAANLSALLGHLRCSQTAVATTPLESLPSSSEFDEAQLTDAFDRLCKHSAGENNQLHFEEWLEWDWLQGKVGPAGSSALLTSAAVEDIWRRVVVTKGLATAGPPEFVELAKVLRSECSRATTIQSVLRGRSGRRRADGASKAEQPSILQEAPKLAPFNPTPECAIMQALEALSVGPGDLIYDLGCGDGRLLVAAAARGARAFGVEYDERYVVKAKERARSAGVTELVEVVHGDACEVDLEPATKIFVYLVPAGLGRLEMAMIAALNRGVPVASYTFSLPGLEPAQVLTAESRAPECKVWVYLRASSLD